MTTVHFYHNAPDPLALTCELVGNAWRGGHKAVVVCPDAAAAQKLDRLLWTQEPSSFIPHVMTPSPLASETPVIIGIKGDDDWPHADLLFNLAPDEPKSCGRFRLLVEIVGRAEAERAPARARWKQYQQRQFPIKAFDAERRVPL